MSDVIDFAQINATLRDVLNTISGIPGQLTQESLQPEFYPQVGVDLLANGELGKNLRARVNFEVVSAIGVGWDEFRTSYDPTVQIPGDTFVPDPTKPDLRLGGFIYETSGARELVIQVKVESWDVSDGNAAQQYIEKIRTRIYLPTISDAFNAVALAVQSISASHTANYDDENGNRVSASIVEITFNAADSAQDDPITTIELIDPDFEVDAQF